MNSAPIESQATRPYRNARRYSTTWKPASPPRGHARLDDAPGLHTRRVGHADRAPDCDHALGILLHRPHHDGEPVRVEDRVGVGDAHVRVAGDVQAGVQRIRAAAVVLAHERDVRGRAAPVELADGLVLEQVPRRRLDPVQAVLLDHPRGGRVGRAVVDDHDLEDGIALAEKRRHRVEDHRLLVEGRDDDRHTGCERRGERLLVPGPPPPPDGLLHAVPGERPEHQVTEVDGRGVDHRHQADDLDGCSHARPAWSMLAAWRSFGCASSSAPTRDTRPGAIAARVAAAISATSAQS